MSIHAVRKGVAGFSNVKYITFITLELVDKVHRHAVCMSSFGVSEIDTRAGERVNGRVNGASLTSGSIAGSGVSVDGWIMGMEASVYNKLAEVGRFAEGDRWRFAKEVLSLCVCVPMPTHCTITCFGFHARWIDGVKCGLFSNHAPLGQTTLRVG